MLGEVGALGALPVWPLAAASRARVTRLCSAAAHLRVAACCMRGQRSTSQRMRQDRSSCGARCAHLDVFLHAACQGLPLKCWRAPAITTHILLEDVRSFALLIDPAPACLSLTGVLLLSTRKPAAPRLAHHGRVCTQARQVRDVMVAFVRPIERSKGRSMQVHR